ncbi:SsgA family sporulation/cell division regulator [Amycolatopsis japonica]
MNEKPPEGQDGVPPALDVHSHTVTFSCESTNDKTVKVGVELTYDPRDPYAIKARFPTSLERFFARDLLDDGLMTASGLGDIRFSPCHRHFECVHIELDFPDGTAYMMANFWELADFLDCTFELVPAGTESSRIDLELELARLTSE